MSDKIMSSPIMIHNITLSVDYNKWLEHVVTQLTEPTNQSSIRSLNWLSQKYENVFKKLLGTSVINSPMSSPSLQLTQRENVLIEITTKLLLMIIYY